MIVVLILLKVFLRGEGEDKQSLFHQQINSGHLRFSNQMDHKKTCLPSDFLNCKIKKGIVDIYIYTHRP